MKAKDRIDDALKEITEIVKSAKCTTDYDTLLMISASFKNYETEKLRIGSSNHERRSEIISSLLGVISKFEQEKIEENNIRESVNRSPYNESDSLDNDLKESSVNKLIENNSVNGLYILLMLLKLRDSKRPTSSRKIAQFLNLSEEFVSGYLTALNGLGVYKYEFVKIENELDKLIYFVNNNIDKNKIQNRIKEIINEIDDSKEFHKIVMSGTERMIDKINNL